MGGAAGTAGAGETDAGAENTAVLCADQIDNDGDSFTDCGDFDCAAFCLTPEDTAVLCADALDNDGDGFTDCDDFDCAPFCV
jgi:hypothetical protein